MKLLNIKKIAFASAFVAGGIFSINASAQSTTVTVGGTAYTVSVSSTASTYSSITSTLQATPWWNNPTLASSLAIAVGGSLGYPNGGGYSGPVFSTAAPGIQGGAVYYNGFTHGSSPFSINSSVAYYWALSTVGAPTSSGPSVANTQASVANTAQALQGTYTLQNAVLANSFAYDCTVFGENNVCVSGGGRNTAVSAANGLNNTSALLIAAYRALPSVRVGAYADQNLSVNNGGSTVNLGNNTPLLGLFAAWNEKQDGTGTEVKASVAYGQKNTTINRGVVGTGSTASEAGSGSSQLNSQGAQITAKYGFGIADQVIVSPYVGIRYTQNNMGGYTEGTSSTVTAPLTYSALNTNATTALAGVGAQYKGIPQTTLFASAGVETDTNTANGSYNATNASIGAIAPVNFNPNPVKTRPIATLGAYYDVEKNQRLGVTGIYRQEAYQATASTTVMATYTVGF
ncbi:autotransporter outer membrane beta-barrel domain-containing protein [Polynucleobacter sp. AP-Nickl1-40-C4]|uniref:autotransporter outer membrane beta-barrel domain-containing protein n=1 Tax=Polynucleobacter sp. AP-Nickl1-40-C4 TaxID=3108275 RepID=UPI002B23DBA0|nr:autotransporter outer membrane beta-barrel domain-containing protein [Polynucleobacter sp. AP-Nickl1-40-C4]MEA9568215.1 autotransporter outer membrane beta-barrel domain-containing protein [Polynucleobacter sp. AP-Nickl1-40-C4]